MFLISLENSFARLTRLCEQRGQARLTDRALPQRQARLTDCLIIESLNHPIESPNPFLDYQPETSLSYAALEKKEPGGIDLPLNGSLFPTQ